MLAWLSQQAQVYGLLILVPVLVFSFLSFLTTAAGVRLFCPEGVTGSLLSLLAALGIQTVLLACSLNLYTHGIRSKYAVIYVLPALVSMMFSYFGLFKQFSGGFLTEQQRTDYSKEFDVYLNATIRAIADARAIGRAARTSAVVLAEHEKTRGQTMQVPASRYLAHLKATSGVDFARLPQGSGSGPIYLFWMQAAKQLEDKEADLESVATMIQDAGDQTKLMSLDAGQKAALAAKLQRSVNWYLVEELIEGEGLPFAQPVPPKLKKRVGGEGDNSNATETEREWAIDALRAIWESWDPATIGVPLAIAIALDLVVFMIPVLFRQKGVDGVSEGDVLAALRAADIEKGGVPERALRAVVNRLRAGSPSRWWLDASDIHRLEPAALAIVEQLERKRAIWPAILANRYRVPRVTYDCLSQLVLTQSTPGQPS